MNKNLSDRQQAVVDQLFSSYGIETIPDAILAVDLHLTIIYMNAAAEALYGWKKEEAVGQREQDIIKTRLLNTTIDSYRKAIRTRGAWNGEAIQQCKTGSRIFVSSSVTVIKNSRGSVIGTVSVNRDISEHKQVEYNLRFLTAAAKAFSSSLNYETTLNRVAQLAVPRIADWCTIELLNDERKLELVAIAHRDPAMVKWALELRKKQAHENPNQSSETGVAKVLKTGKAEFHPFIPDNILSAAAENPRQLALLRKLGLTSIIIVPIMSENAPIGAITLISSDSRRHYTDIDLQMAEKLASRASLAIENAKLYRNAEREIQERRQMEERLRDSEHRLDIILKSVADGITMQSPEGDIVYANDIAATATGFTSAREMMSVSAQELAKRISQFEMRNEEGGMLSIENLPGREALRKEGVSEKKIQFIDTATGGTRWSHVKSRAVRNEKGDMIYMVNIVSDITEREELEKRKDNFISMASHELKTPITTLKIYTDLLSEQLGAAGDMRFKQPLDMMRSQIDKLTALIADLLNHSKIQSGKLDFRMHRFNMSDVVEDISRQLGPSLKHKLDIRGNSARNIYGDPDRIGQVLINLLTNAEKYSPKKGKIEVRVSDTRDSVKVCVKDQGMGISKAHQTKIFERFYQVGNDDKTFPGLGIGLYISKEIMSRHGGKIWVESIQGKGSTFCFSIPFGSPATKKTK